MNPDRTKRLARALSSMIADKSLQNFEKGTILMANDSDGKQNAKELIEKNLKDLYQEALDKEVPDRFKALLQNLKAAEGKDGDPL